MDYMTNILPDSNILLNMGENTEKTRILTQ